MAQPNDKYYADGKDPKHKTFFGGDIRGSFTDHLKEQ